MKQQNRAAGHSQPRSELAATGSFISRSRNRQKRNSKSQETEPRFRLSLQLRLLQPAKKIAKLNSPRVSNGRLLDRNENWLNAMHLRVFHGQLRDHSFSAPNSYDRFAERISLVGRDLSGQRGQIFDEVFATNHRARGIVCAVIFQTPGFHPAPRSSSESTACRARLARLRVGSTGSRCGRCQGSLTIFDQSSSVRPAG